MKHSLVTRLTAFLTALLLMIGFVPGFVEAADNDGLTLCLHYDRPDGNYTGWSVWFWVEGSDAADVPLQEENGEMVAKFDLPEGADSVGFIVKQPNWAAKDVDKDQFVDVAECLSGTVHVSVSAGAEGYEMTYGEDVITGIKVKEVRYQEGAGIRAVLTQPLPEAETCFALSGPEGDVDITDVTAEGGTYILTTAQNLDALAVYTLTCQGVDYPVQMPNVYSTEEFEAAYTYTGEDLGANWSAEKTSFRLWAPTAASVQVNLYENGTAGTQDLLEQLEMIPDVNGTWIAEKQGDLNGIYYTYLVEVGGKTVEACDPYARTTGVNSLKWNDLNQEAYQNVYRYYQGLIAFRKAHPALRMTSPEDVTGHIENLTGLDFNVTGFRILPGANGEETEFVMIFNPRSEATTVALPEGKWDIFINDKAAGLDTLGTAEAEVSVAPISAMVLVKQVPRNPMNNLMIPGLLALAGAALFLVRKLRKK